MTQVILLEIGIAQCFKQQNYSNQVTRQQKS